MRLTEKERAEALRVAAELLEKLEDAGLFLTMNTAIICLEQQQKPYWSDEADHEAAAEGVRNITVAQKGQNIIAFPRR